MFETQMGKAAVKWFLDRNQTHTKNPEYEIILILHMETDTSLVNVSARTNYIASTHSVISSFFLCVWFVHFLIFSINVCMYIGVCL